eukprot:1039387-Pleurochrysis_carterae.AAC.2
MLRRLAALLPRVRRATPSHRNCTTVVSLEVGTREIRDETYRNRAYQHKLVALPSIVIQVRYSDVVRPGHT